LLETKRGATRYAGGRRGGRENIPSPRHSLKGFRTPNFDSPLCEAPSPVRLKKEENQFSLRMHWVPYPFATLLFPGGGGVIEARHAQGCETHESG